MWCNKRYAHQHAYTGDYFLRGGLNLQKYSEDGFYDHAEPDSLMKVVKLHYQGIKMHAFSSLLFCMFYQKEAVYQEDAVKFS